MDVAGLLNNFTYVKMRGPNKLIETETELKKKFYKAFDTTYLSFLLVDENVNLTMAHCMHRTK